MVTLEGDALEGHTFYIDLIQISMLPFIAVLSNKASISNVTTVHTIVYEITNVNVSKVCPTSTRATNVYTSLYVIYCIIA